MPKILRSYLLGILLVLKATSGEAAPVCLDKFCLDAYQSVTAHTVLTKLGGTLEPYALNLQQTCYEQKATSSNNAQFIRFIYIKDFDTSEWVANTISLTDASLGIIACSKIYPLASSFKPEFFKLKIGDSLKKVDRLYGKSEFNRVLPTTEFMLYDIQVINPTKQYSRRVYRSGLIVYGDNVTNRIIRLEYSWGDP